MPASAAIVRETNASGSPKPITRKPGKRFFQYEPSTETCVNRTSPRVITDMPTTSVGFTPTRVTAAAATLAQMIAVPATAR